MAFRWGKLLAGGTGGGGVKSSGGGVGIVWENAALVNDLLNKITQDVADADARRVIRSTASSRLRQEVKTVTDKALVPTLKMSATQSRTKIAKHMSIRSKADRFVFVQIGSVNPTGLKGFRPYIGSKRSKGKITAGKRGATSRTYRTTLAWGSEFGPWPNARAPKADGTRGAPKNVYAVPRRQSGYWVQPGVKITMPKIRTEYQAALARVLDLYTRRY